LRRAIPCRSMGGMRNGIAQGCIEIKLGIEWDTERRALRSLREQLSDISSNAGHDKRQHDLSAQNSHNPITSWVLRYPRSRLIEIKQAALTQHAAVCFAFVTAYAVTE